MSKESSLFVPVECLVASTLQQRRLQLLHRAVLRTLAWRSREDGHVGNVPHNDRHRVHSTGFALPNWIATPAHQNLDGTQRISEC